MIPENLSWLADHLWQSTLFTAVAGVLTFMLRKNRASVRYWIWTAASLKFLIPFSLLVSVGSRYEWRPISAAVKPEFVSTVGGIAQPFSPVTEVSLVMTHPESQQKDRLPILVLVIWFCGVAIVGFSWFRQWRRMRKVVIASSPLALNVPLKAAASDACLEPGVVGILRPVLLLPNGITDRLTSQQLEAILIHELCHVRRRDNLAAAIHMFVETLFWFHPLVWWLERRLVSERERACDQEVLRVIGTPETYAEGILNVCKFYKESPLVCVSGVTGSNLKNRIEEIMMNRVLHKLGVARTSLLVIVALSAVALPVGFGIVKASQNPPRPATAAPVTSTSTETPPLLAQQTPERTTAQQEQNVSSQPTQEKKSTESWLEQIEAAGFRNLNIDQLIRLKEHEIDAQYIQSVRAQGFDLNLDQLVRFREHEITGDFVKEMEQVGLRNLSADELMIRLKEHEATAAWIKSIQAMGYPEISTNDVIRLLEHEVTPNFIREVKNRFKDATLDQLIRLKEHDILPNR